MVRVLGRQPSARVVETPSRWRLRRRIGTRRPSSRHSRWMALRLTVHPLLAELGVSTPIPHVGRDRLSRCSSSRRARYRSGSRGWWRWVGGLGLMTINPTPKALVSTGSSTTSSGHSPGQAGLTRCCPRGYARLRSCMPACATDGHFSASVHPCAAPRSARIARPASRRT
jgi:hypothetical protein